MRWGVGVVGCVAAILVSAQEVSEVKVGKAFVPHIELIEGFRARAYRDVGGVWTIGYGHAIKPSEGHLKKAILTREQAAELLKEDVRDAEDAVNTYVKVPLKQEQFDALVSFTFNVGGGALKRSTLLEKLNAGHCCAVPDELRRWRRAGGKVVAGLVARREKEIALYVGDA